MRFAAGLVDMLMKAQGLRVALFNQDALACTDPKATAGATEVMRGGMVQMGHVNKQQQVKTVGRAGTGDIALLSSRPPGSCT